MLALVRIVEDRATESSLCTVRVRSSCGGLAARIYTTYILQYRLTSCSRRSMSKWRNSSTVPSIVVRTRGQL